MRSPKFQLTAISEEQYEDVLLGSLMDIADTHPADEQTWTLAAI